MLLRRPVRGLRRAALAVALGGVIGVVLRFRGSTETPPQQGGWRELDGPDLR
jgi:hypothetical protein